MDIKKISLLITFIVGISAAINVIFGWIVPRSEFIQALDSIQEEIADIKLTIPNLPTRAEVFNEINRVELAAMEGEIVRLEKKKCERASSTLDQYLLCIDDVSYKEAIRYFNLNK